MKNTISLLKLWAICAIFTGLLSSFTSDRVSVKITESDTKYELEASYNAAKTERVQAYMNKCITGPHDISFRNAQLDATITLDGRMTFYVKSEPGELHLKFDKRKNSREDYEKFKKMCEGIKDIVGDK